MLPFLGGVASVLMAWGKLGPCWKPHQTVLMVKRKYAGGGALSELVWPISWVIRGVCQQPSWLQLRQLLPAGFEHVRCEWMFRKGFLVTELLWQFPMASVSSERLTAQFRKFVTHFFLLFHPPRNPTVNSAVWMLCPSSFSSLNPTHSSGPKSSPISSPTRHLFWVPNGPTLTSELPEPLINCYVFWF